jgi:hypothetical protein
MPFEVETKLVLLVGVPVFDADVQVLEKREEMGNEFNA